MYPFLTFLISYAQFSNLTAQSTMTQYCFQLIGKF